jgi:hypothetical protein
MGLSVWASVSGCKKVMMKMVVVAMPVSMDATISHTRRMQAGMSWRFPCGSVRWVQGF